MDELAGTEFGKVTLKVALQEASVETFADPINVWPSPKVDASQDGLEKN